MIGGKDEGSKPSSNILGSRRPRQLGDKMKKYEMKKKEVVLPDGRKLIFYDFKEKVEKKKGKTPCPK